MDDPAKILASARDALRAEVQKCIIGQQRPAELLFITLLCGGHALLLGVPGVGKTLVAKALARSVAGDFCRLQFTPDLLPSDILGSSVFDSKGGQFVFHRGPIFAHIVQRW